MHNLTFLLYLIRQYSSTLIKVEFGCLSVARREDGKAYKPEIQIFSKAIFSKSNLFLLNVLAVFDPILYPLLMIFILRYLHRSKQFVLQNKIKFIPNLFPFEKF